MMSILERFHDELVLGAVTLTPPSANVGTDSSTLVFLQGQSPELARKTHPSHYFPLALRLLPVTAQ